MADDTLIAAIERHESLAETYGDLSEDRSKALDYYLGNPLGNEVDGRSQVVSRDVWDAVEWIKPQLADIFCGGDEIINFTPRGPEDVQGAEQETDFVNYIITQKNDWFTTFYGWSHDALLQKNGYVKAYWDDHEDRTKESYEGLTADELTVLQQANPDAKVVEQEVVEVEGERTYSVTLERSNRYGCAKFMGVAPEHIFVDHNALGLSLQDPAVAFVEQREYKTLTQLRDEGYDVPSDLSDGGDGVGDWEEDLRDEYSPFRNREGEEADPSMRRLKVREVWIRFDRDDDGRAELLHVVLVGTTILLEEEADMVPIVALCPTPMPHQHYGLSVADAVMDLQRIKTALWRGSLDNLYLANNGRYAVDEDAVNRDDMLVSRPGGIVRVKSGRLQEGAILPLTHSTTGDVAIPMMEYVDRIQQKRTGVNEQSQGLDPNSLNNKTLGAAQIYMTAAQQRIRFIARVFAETGVKSLFQIVHALTLKHSRQPEIVRLRNRWVPVDPRHWVKRSDMQISVALGAGDKQQQIAFLTQVLQIQQLAIQAGLTDPPRIYNTLKRMTQAAGFKDPEEFWTDPSTQQPKPPQPDPEVMKEQAKIQGQMQIEQGKAQTQMLIAREQNALKMREIEANLALQAANDQRDAERERMKAEYQAAIEQQKIAMEEWKAQLEAELQRYTTDADNQTKLHIAGMQAEQQAQSEALQMGHEATQKSEDRGHQMQMSRETAQQKAQEKQSMESKKDDTKATLDKVSKALESLAEMQKKLMETNQDVLAAVKAKRVLVRDKEGRAVSSEIQE